jgi:hypothetical protein
VDSWSLAQEQDVVTSFKDIDDLPTISDQLLNVARPTHKKMTLTVKFSEMMKRYVEDSLVLTRFAIMGMFDEADEITLPFEASTSSKPFWM